MNAALIQVFIEEFLKHHGIRGLFGKGVSTNGGVFTDDGRLDVQPYHTNQEEPHGCSLCPPNMCKGESSAREGCVRHARSLPPYRREAGVGPWVVYV